MFAQFTPPMVPMTFITGAARVADVAIGLLLLLRLPVVLRHGSRKNEERKLNLLKKIHTVNT